MTVRLGPGAARLMTVRLGRGAARLMIALALITSQAMSARAAARAPELQIRLRSQQQLARGAHTALELVVQLPQASAELPLLLTPHIEGAAVELVRGRLLRSDAKQLDPTHLRFAIPVVARSQGTAILRVVAMTYVCDRSCRRIQTSTRAVLEVR